MTDRRRQVPVAAIAGALFCVILIYLALQIRAGKDPAIGAGRQAAAPAPRLVIVRRVIVRRIVEERAPAPAPATSAPGPAPVAAPAAAPPASPPAPARAPAPAPAPPPVVSRGS